MPKKVSAKKNDGVSFASLSDDSTDLVSGAASLKDYANPARSRALMSGERFGFVDRLHQVLSTDRQLHNKLVIDEIYDCLDADARNAALHIFNNLENESALEWWSEALSVVYNKTSVINSADVVLQNVYKVIDLLSVLNLASTNYFEGVVYDSVRQRFAFKIPYKFHHEGRYASCRYVENYFRIFLDQALFPVSEDNIGIINREKGRFGSPEVFAAQLLAAVYIQKLGAVFTVNSHIHELKFEFPILLSTEQLSRLVAMIQNKNAQVDRHYHDQKERMLDDNNETAHEVKLGVEAVSLVDDSMVIRKIAQKKYQALFPKESFPQAVLNVVEYDPDLAIMKSNLKNVMPYTRVLILDQTLGLTDNGKGTDLLVYLKRISGLFNPESQVIIFNSGGLVEVLDELEILRNTYENKGFLLGPNEHYLAVGKETDFDSLLTLAHNLTPERAYRLAEIQLREYRAAQCIDAKLVATRCSLESVLAIERTCQAETTEELVVGLCEHGIGSAVKAVDNIVSMMVSSGFYTAPVKNISLVNGVDGGDSEGCVRGDIKPSGVGN